jgi:hypothetical protein
VSEPILLELLVEEPLILAPVNFTPVLAEPLFMASEARLFESGDKAKLDGLSLVGWGAKSSATDPGALFEMSVTDDYLFVCVRAGEAGSAVWKRTILFKI